jgi:hypothetical protein
VGCVGSLGEAFNEGGHPTMVPERASLARSAGQR